MSIMGVSPTFDVDVDVDVTVSEASASDYAALVLPGGVANPDALRTDPAAVALVKQFLDAGQPVFSICHAAWTLVGADGVRGRRLTSWPSLRTDVSNTGGQCVDEELVLDDNGPGLLVTSRKPDDLKAFCAAVVEHAAT